MAKIIDVSCVRQKHEFDCGAAVFRSILQTHSGSEISRRDAIRAVGSNVKTGTSAYRIHTALSSRGVPNRFVRNATKETLMDAVSSSMPVAIILQAHGCGHWVVAVGADETALYVMDPYSGDIAMVPMGSLDDRWASDAEKTKRPAIIGEFETRSKETSTDTEMPLNEGFRHWLLAASRTTS